MTTLDNIMTALECRKVHFDRPKFVQVMWDEAVIQLKDSGVPEPYTVDDIVPKMIERGKYVLRVADDIYRKYDRPLNLDFDDI